MWVSVILVILVVTSSILQFYVFYIARRYSCLIKRIQRDHGIVRSIQVHRSKAPIQKSQGTRKSIGPRKSSVNTKNRLWAVVLKLNYYGIFKKSGIGAEWCQNLVKFGFLLRFETFIFKNIGFGFHTRLICNVHIDHWRFLDYCSWP